MRVRRASAKESCGAWEKGLQRGRTRESAERQFAVIPASVRNGFNEAALVRVRREPSARCRRSNNPSFNEAALVRVRRGIALLTRAARRNLLQRGRTRESAESQIESLMALINACFNEAALVRVRRVADVEAALRSLGASTRPHS